MKKTELKIAIVAPFDFNENYGNTIRPLNQIKELLKKGIHTKLYCTKRKNKLMVRQCEIQKPFFTIPKILRPKDISFIFDLPIIKKQIFKDENIIHLNNYYSVLILPKNVNKKIITDFHGLKSIALSDIMENAGFLKKSIYNMIVIPLIKKLERRTIEISDKIIVASKNIKQWIMIIWRVYGIFSRDFMMKNIFMKGKKFYYTVQDVKLL